MTFIIRLPRGKIMDYAKAMALLKEHGQTQLLKYYDELSDEQKRILLDEIEHLDFSIIDRAGKDAKRAQGKITPADAVTVADRMRCSARIRSLSYRLKRHTRYRRCPCCASPSGMMSSCRSLPLALR